LTLWCFSDDEIWLQNEIPPWEGEEVPDDLSVDDSDGENDLIDVVSSTELLLMGQIL